MRKAIASRWFIGSGRTILQTYDVGPNPLPKPQSPHREKRRYNRKRSRTDSRVDVCGAESDYGAASAGNTNLLNQSKFLRIASTASLGSWIICSCPS